MNSFAEQDLSIKNVDSPFTEIFSILSKYQMLSDKSLVLEYKIDELMIMREHVSNAVASTLQGLQCSGDVLSILGKDFGYGTINGIGTLISLVSNLLDALTKVRMDIEYTLCVFNKM